MSKKNKEKEMKIERAEKTPAAMDLWNTDFPFRDPMMFRRPFALMRMFDEMRPRLFNYDLPGFFETYPFEAIRTERAEWTPKFETFRKDDHFVVKAELPGMKKEDIVVDVDEHFVTLKGKREKKFEEKKEDYFRSEFTYGDFYRKMPLPEGVDTNDAKAVFKDGVLEITFAATEPATETKRIEIADAEPKKMTAGK
ncbi:MAG: Hsp20/alpha crystallin family protein [Acidobacteriota bacterium]|nr:MAG: Hsp20/alpha crystallin family protein [Acidobacteriota bacterium]